MKKLFLFLAFLFFSLSLSAQDERAFPSVSFFRGEVRNNLVRLSWQDSPDARGPVYIYRTQYPFNPDSFETILTRDLFSGSLPIIIPYGVEFYIDEIDYQGVYYYFAASSDETGLIFDYISFQNNFIAVSMNGVLPPPPNLRFRMISPVDSIFEEIFSNETPPPQTRTSNDLHPDIAFLLEGIPVRAPPSPTERNPMYFIQDLNAAHGDDLILSSIVTGAFWDMDWTTARDELLSFLAVSGSSEIKARARFYLGQCFYFLHMPREGLLEFLVIQDVFPAESAEWVEACLVIFRN